MSASVSQPWPARPAAAERLGERPRWHAGGVAAEIADRLSVPVGFIRGLLILAAVAQHELMYAYMALALVLPHAGRRTPGWSNLVALGRVAVLFLVIANFFYGGGGLNSGGSVFDQGPAAWLPFAGVSLFGMLAVLLSGRRVGDRDPAADRVAGVATLLALAGLGLLALAVALVPAVDWQFGVGALAAIGGVWLAARRTRAAGAVVPVMLLAVCAVLAASAGVRLQGGIGNATAAPRSLGAVATSYRRAVGDLRLDLTGLARDAGNVDVTATVGIGNLHVYLPTSAQVTAVLGVGRGTIEVLSCTSRTPSPRYGFDQVTTFTIGAEQAAPGRPSCGGPRAQPALRIRIHARVGVGTIDVTEPPWVVGGPW